MQKTINQIIDQEYKAIAGTKLNIKLPISQSLMQSIVTDQVKGESINWATVQVGPDNLVLLKLNLTARIIFKTSFTLAIYLKLKEKVEVSDSFTALAKIHGVENGLGFGKRKIMNMFRTEVSQNLPPYLAFQKDWFFINLKEYFATYDFPPLEKFLKELNLSTAFVEDNPPEVADKEHRVWIKTHLAIDKTATNQKIK